MVADLRGGSLADVGGETAVYLRGAVFRTHLLGVPAALGKSAVRKANLVGLLDGYFHHGTGKKAGGMNVNVMNREMLLVAIEHPENYQSLTTRFPAMPCASIR